MKTIQNRHIMLKPKRDKYEASATTIQEDVAGLSQRLQARARKLQKKSRTRNDRAYWKTRGRQQILWRVSAHLRAMQMAYSSSYVCYLALKEYLDYCLEKYQIDAYEEKYTSCAKKALSPQLLKAEGEAQELPAIREALSGILKVHTPPFVDHTLSLNGKSLVPLWQKANGGAPLAREEEVSAVAIQ